MEQIIMLMIDEELDGDVLEGTEPVIDPAMFIYPKVEDECSFFSELEPGIG